MGKRDHGFAIVIAERGHVWVGDVTTDERWCEITGARIVRFWGTTKGLNQLANSGPTNKTTLDEAAELPIAINMRAVIGIIPCKGRW